MTNKPAELAPEALRRVCDPSKLDFETTAHLPAISEVLGQPRAVAALEFGTSIDSHGFNLFALGQPGSGKTTLIREYLERRAAAEPVPPDLCYVNNFGDARRPLPLYLPPGQGLRLKRDIDALVRELRDAIPRAFDKREYSSQRDKIVHELEEKQQNEFARLDRQVAEAGFRLIKAPTGFLLVPAVGGKPLGDDDLERLTPEDREKVARVRERLQREIEDRLRDLRELEKGTRDVLHALDTETAAFVVRQLIDDLRATYHDQPATLDYLEALEKDTIAHAGDFRKDKEADGPQLPVPFALAAGIEKPFARYAVNVLIDNGDLKGAPVVVESNPTYHNLTGRVEHQAAWGGSFTDHTLIKPGALHRASGGYLIIPARECLLNPFAWEGLKRALKDRLLRIEELGAHLSLISTVTLDPEPVGLDVKVVLIGSALLYYLLFAYDEDFQKLFKVKVDFTTKMERTADAERAYAVFAGTIARQEKTLPFDRSAVARLIEYGSRVAEDQEQLSTRFGEIADLIREAAHHASRASRDTVTATDVRDAEEARRYRQNLAQQRLEEQIANGTVLLETAGTAVGRLNGLSVVGLGDYSFGHPVRLTATAGPGRRGVISIEREVELSGPIHGKGVLILSGYLLHKYGQTGPLSLSASLVFEQSYSMVEGDSASLAELCVLLSVLAEAPLRQDVAVTGSVNQYGQVQAVGGVTEKVEGFFDACQAKGLTGSQGVLIPATNRRNLMLRDDIVDAVRAGQFHLWAAEELDDAIALLTGMAAGKPDEKGEYPEGSIHRAVLTRLTSYAETLRALAGKEEDKRAA